MTLSCTDYLSKQLFIEKNIVTYRSLSRALKIHVNVAKNELANFHASNVSASPASFATFLLSGKTVLSHNDKGSQMDVDTQETGNQEASEDSDEDQHVEDVPAVQILLVGQDELQASKSRFSHVQALHVYSLSPAPIRDVALLCSPTPALRDIDNGKDGVELARIVGKVVSSDVKIPVGPVKKSAKPPAPVAGPSKTKSTSEKDPDVAKAAESSKTKTEINPKEKATLVADKKKEVKPKATGKLDFSNAKTKEMKKEEAKEAKAELKKAASKITPAASTSTSRAGSENINELKEDTKRGVKRKSVAPTPSDSEDTAGQSSRTNTMKLPVKPLPTSNLRVKRGVVLSDDEEEEILPTKSTRRKSKAVVVELDSDVDEVDEKLKTMMDVDDDEVIKVSRVAAVKQEEEESEEDEVVVSDKPVDHDDVDMSDDAPPVRKAPKKVKKVVPVGRNGLKKKRVVKSKTAKDAKGYMVTEDYSSYESVDEEETPPPKATKGKGKAKPEPAAGNESEASIPPIKAPVKSKGTAVPKPKGKAVAKKNTITNFFAPPPKK